LTNLLLDTNIIVDYFSDNDFAEQAEQIIEVCSNDKISGFMNASSVTDVYYILRKKFKHDELIESLRALFVVIDIINVEKSDIFLAMDNNVRDLEDALVSCCAHKVKADYIITRNAKDFANSSIKAVEPSDFLSDYGGDA
jgi:predicted nucleic acid-binding protein